MEDGKSYSWQENTVGIGNARVCALLRTDQLQKAIISFNSIFKGLHSRNNLTSNTTSPALSGGKLDRCASGIGLHMKWIRETL